MWVSQNYLADVGGTAHCYVYYVFENYNSDQVSYTKVIEPVLSRFGETFGSRIHLFGPNPIGADNIESQVRKKFRHLWHDMQGRLPGLLIVRTPLSRYSPEGDEGLFLSLRDNPEEILLSVSDLLVEQDKYAGSRPLDHPDPSLLKKILKRVSVSLKIGPI